MAFKDSLRLEQIYFQKLKDTIQTLKVLNEGENTEKEQDIIEGLVEACAAILLLYRNLGEEWNELTALIQKTMHDLVDLKDQSDAYHDELNEKIDEVNNYLNAAIGVIEAEINAFGGLPSNANANEGDVLTVGEDGVNEWTSPSGGLEILTLEWYTDLEQERSYYLLKDPSGEPIATLSDANEWYEKGAIIHVLSVNPESFVLNYNKTNSAIVDEETVYVSPVVGRFLYPSHYEYSYLEVFSKNPIWTGYETDTRNDTVLAHIIFEYIGLSSSTLNCTNVEGTSLRLNILDEGPLGFFVDGEGSTPLAIACGYDTAIAKGINVEVFNIVQRQNFYSTCERVNVTKFDYLSPSEVAALLESGDPTQATNTNGILIYLENGDKILGYTSNNLTRGFYEDVYKYIAQEGAPFNIQVEGGGSTSISCRIATGINQDSSMIWSADSLTLSIPYNDVINLPKIDFDFSGTTLKLSCIEFPSGTTYPQGLPTGVQAGSEPDTLQILWECSDPNISIYEGATINVTVIDK